jgi:uncharacterized Zn finger protein (UPF0148 family)
MTKIYRTTLSEIKKLIKEQSHYSKDMEALKQIIKDLSKISESQKLSRYNYEEELLDSCIERLKVITFDYSLDD